MAELICDKLEDLEVANIRISPLKLLAIQVEVRMTSTSVHQTNLSLSQTLYLAWQSSALSAGYMQKALADFSRQMLQIESNEVAPPGWRAVWDRYGTTSFLLFHTLATFHCNHLVSAAT